MSYQVAKLIARIAENLPEMDENVMQGWIESPKGLQKVLREALCPPQQAIQQPLTWPEAMEKAYQLLGLHNEFTRFLTESDGFKEVEGCWTLTMVKGLTYSHLVKAYKAAGVTLELFGVDLEKAINPEEEQRDSNRDGSYLVSFKSNIEADPENANQSAHQRKQQNCKDTTLADRLLLGLVYFLMSGNHLDIKNITLCPGSRNHVGLVPSVDFHADDGKVLVRWYDPDSRLDDLRARSVRS